MISEPFGRLRRFPRELNRRKVYRVAALCVGVAFIVAQAANLIFPALNIPSWTDSLVVGLVLLEFGVAQRRLARPKRMTSRGKGWLTQQLGGLRMSR